MRDRIFVVVFLILITVAVFWRVVGDKFVYDDYEYLVENPHVQDGLTLESAAWAFVSTRCSNWHPVTWLSHLLDCEIYGMKPTGHLLTNLLFHLANVLLLFFILSRMTGYMWRSAFVAALFAVHPLHVESVAWVAERKDVLSTFFLMLTLLAYVRYVKQPGLRRYLLVAGLFALGLMSKPMLVTLPFVLLLLDYWPLGRLKVENGKRRSGVWSQWRGLVTEKWLLFALSLASSVVTLVAQRKGGAVGGLAEYPFGFRVSNALVSYVGYIWKMIWPSGLAAFYPHPGKGLPYWQIIGAGLLLAAVTILVVLVSRKRPYLCVGWLWYMGTLVPVIGLVQVGWQAMADRYTYVPLIGLFIMIAWGVPALLARVGMKNERCLTAPALTIIFILMVLACIQTSYWRDNVTLFERALACTTRNDVAHNNLGLALVGQGKLNEAIEHYRQAIAIRPDSAKVHYNLGIVLAREGKLDEAIAEYETAIRLRPGYVKALDNLSAILVRKGKIGEVAANLSQTLQFDPDNAEAANNLAWILATNEDPKFRNGTKAVELALRACRIAKYKDPSALDTLAAAYAEVGRFEEAVDTAERALAIAASAKQASLANEIRARLYLYERHHPFHCPSVASAKE